MGGGAFPGPFGSLCSSDVRGWPGLPQLQAAPGRSIASRAHRPLAVTILYSALKAARTTGPGGTAQL
jgi:hypothetical protein